MNGEVTPRTTNYRFGWHADVPVEVLSDDRFTGIRFRRVMAWLIDVIVIGLIWVGFWLISLVLSVVSFGLLTPILFAVAGVIPLIYHTIMIGGYSRATIGMRMMNMRAYSFDGNRPNYVQALIFAFFFYLSVSLTSFLIILVALFNYRGRLMHDYLSGLIVARDDT